MPAWVSRDNIKSTHNTTIAKVTPPSAPVRTVTTCCSWSCAEAEKGRKAAARCYQSIRGGCIYVRRPALSQGHDDDGNVLGISGDLGHRSHTRVLHTPVFGGTALEDASNDPIGRLVSQQPIEYPLVCDQASP